MFVSIDRRYKVFVVSLFCVKHLCRDTTINLIIVTSLTLLYKDNCNSAPIPNILTILSALQTLEHDLFLGIIHSLLKKDLIFFLKLIGKKETYDGELSGRRIRRVMTTFWWL